MTTGANELQAGFRSLPAEFQEIILLAQERFQIQVTPLQTLAGGFSGANVFLVSVASQESGLVEHGVLKLDHKNEKARSDEVKRHQAAVSLSPELFARQYIPRIIYDKVEQSGAIAIFYEIAGQSLHLYRPFSAFETQEQSTVILSETMKRVLTDWNVQRRFNQAVHPQKLLDQWLGFRLQPGTPVEQFLETTCGVRADMPGFLIHDTLFPNPLAYARNPELWGNARPLDIAIGFQHGDLNVNNILVKLARQSTTIEGYYLIDFALFKEEMPLLYDLRYLEMSFLNLRQQQLSFNRMIDLLMGYRDAELLDPRLYPVELAGISSIIGGFQQAFMTWVNENHPSMQDDLWGQYWLAGTAAGMSFCHKAGLSDAERMAGLVFAAANLKRYMTLFGLAAPNQGVQLFDPLQWNNYRVDNSYTLRASPHEFSNLPIQSTSFIGRDPELTVLRGLLKDDKIRLITLTGPGGTGKTRLALQAVFGLDGDFPDGIFFVDLAEASSADMVVSKIARTLGVREGGSQPLLESLQVYLHDKKMLLILDNMEQVVSAALEVATLSSAAPGLKILVTSRILLQLHVEHEFSVPPLVLQSSSEYLTSEAVSRGDATRLFVERAQTVNPLFSLNAENAKVVAEICRQLDGLPLAIELAAARVKILSPEALLARLGRRLLILTGGGRDIPTRQQTMRNAIDWSYHLLQDKDQILFTLLGVFAGGFTLESAEEVCNQDGSLDILEGVTVLVNNSLVRNEMGLHGQPRLRMMEMIREYALEKLGEKDVFKDVQGAHAMYYINKVMKEAGLRIYSSEDLRWLNWYESEHDNIRAALEWASANPQMVDLLSPLLFFLAWFWYRRGYLDEGRGWAKRILEATLGQGVTPSRAFALSSAAFLGVWTGDLTSAKSMAIENLETWHRLEDGQGIAIGSLIMGVVQVNLGNYQAARTVLIEALDLYEQMGNRFFSSMVMVHLGNTALGEGNSPEALEWLNKAHVMSREVGDEWLNAFALNNLGEVARTMGDYPLARRYYQDSEELLRSTGDKGDLARLTHNLGCVDIGEGDYAAAERHIRESLALFRKLGNQRGIAECLATLARLSTALDHPHNAARLLGSAEGLIEGIRAAWWPADRVEINSSRNELILNLGEKTFDAEIAQGRLMSIEQALADLANDRD